MKASATLLLASLALSGCDSLGFDCRYNRSTHLWATDHGTFGRDPVSGDPVWVTRAVTRSYLGETYYFENEEHAREFSASPDRFAYDDRNPEVQEAALRPVAR